VATRAWFTRGSGAHVEMVRSGGTVSRDNQQTLGSPQQIRSEISQENNPIPFKSRLRVRVGFAHPAAPEKPQSRMLCAERWRHPLWAQKLRQMWHGVGRRCWGPAQPAGPSSLRAQGQRDAVLHRNPRGYEI